MTFRSDVERKGADLCRAAAAALVPVVALLFAGFVAFLRLANASSSLVGWLRLSAPAPLVLWAAAGAGLVWELLPWEWSSVPADATGIKREYLKLVAQRKRGLRWIGAVILVGIACAVAVLVAA